MIKKRSQFQRSIILLGLLAANIVIAENSFIPAESKIGSSGLQKMILNPMVQNSVLRKGAWRMNQSSDNPAEIEAKCGSEALRLQGKADIKGSKGDFSLANKIPGECRIIGAWVFLDEKSNVENLGFQIYDAEGEALMATVPADWSGWKWIEIEVEETKFTQAYKQDDKNSKPDMPLNSAHFIWFAAAPGMSGCVVDGLVSANKIAPGTMPPFIIQASENDRGERNSSFRTDITITNFTDQPLPCKIRYSLQEDSSLFNETVPDPVFGSDHATEGTSWVEVDGEKIDDNSLTDGDDSTNYGTPYKRGHYTEAFQFVDLGKIRNISRIDFKSGDANWCWDMDVHASTDGSKYTPVSGLQKIDMHKKWGVFTVGPEKPFAARFIKLHYKTRNGKKENVIRMPSAIMLYDGTADEKMDIPKVGRELCGEENTVTVPPKNFISVPIETQQKLDTGAYFAGIQVSHGDTEQLFYKNYFIMPEKLDEVSRDSRFGVNASSLPLAEFHEKMGLGWVRFENMKWAFISPQKDKFAFDGSVAPWYVRQDEIIREYTETYGLNYLPYVFLTPDWATTAPAGHRNSKGFPPKDYNDYGTCIFQIVARYGTKKHPADKLLTNDKISGMNKLSVIELWNEPNLNAESWGPWVGSIEQFFKIFRIGAEAAKKADPEILVTSCGWAGIQLDVIGKMETHKYPDGKTPVDFADILNVHYYSGKADPEIATVDRNVRRGAKPNPGDRTFEDDLRSLVDWWNRVKPGNKPIWLTETGYDVGGPIGLDERAQAAKLPRVTMMAMAAGIDKVFIYREKGSNPAQHAGAGFLRNDDSMRPSWFAYATLVRQLHGVKTSKVPRLVFPENKNIWAYLWDRNGEKLLSVWSLDDKALLPLNLGKCTVTDSFGRKKEIDVDGKLPLSIFPLYISDISNSEPVNKLYKDALIREEAAKARQKQLAELQKYLFDFGGTEHIGLLKGYGSDIRFTPILAAETYSREKGYGFNTAAMEDQTAAWMESSLDKDSVKLRYQEFIIDVKPGKYKLEVGAAPFAASEKIIIKGDVGGEKSSTISKADAKFATDITVDKQPVSVSFGNYTNLRWISIIEKE